MSSNEEMYKKSFDAIDQLTDVEEKKSELEKIKAEAGAFRHDDVMKLAEEKINALTSRVEALDGKEDEIKKRTADVDAQITEVQKESEARVAAVTSSDIESKDNSEALKIQKLEEAGTIAFEITKELYKQSENDYAEERATGKTPIDVTGIHNPFFNSPHFKYFIKRTEPFLNDFKESGNLQAYLLLKARTLFNNVSIDTIAHVLLREDPSIISQAREEILPIEQKNQLDDLLVVQALKDKDRVERVAERKLDNSEQLKEVLFEGDDIPDEWPKGKVRLDKKSKNALAYYLDNPQLGDEYKARKVSEMPVYGKFSEHTQKYIERIRNENHDDNIEVHKTRDIRERAINQVEEILNSGALEQLEAKAEMTQIARNCLNAIKNDLPNIRVGELMDHNKTDIQVFAYDFNKICSLDPTLKPEALQILGEMADKLSKGVAADKRYSANAIKTSEDAIKRAREIFNNN